MKKLALVLIVVSLAACGQDKIKPNDKAKSIKPSQAIMLDMPGYTRGDLELMNSIKTNNVRRVIAVLDAGTASPFSTDKDDLSGLSLAASLHNKEIVEALLSKTQQGQEKVLDRGDKTGRTPLMYAADAKAADIITMLRKKGANPNIYDNEQNFALLIAVNNNDLPSVLAIIHDYDDQYPANPDIPNAKGETAIIVAAINKNKEIMQALKDYGADLNSADAEGVTPLIAAVNAKDKPLFDFILSLGANINALSSTTQRTPLIYSLETKNYDFAKYILEKGADPNVHAEGLSSALQTVVSNEEADPNIVDMLLAKGGKLNDSTMPLGNVLGRAIHKGNAPAIAKLLAKGAKVSDLETPTTNGLIQALNVDDADIALLMINNNVNIAKIDENGFSPLALAAKKNFTTVFDALVKKGADVNQTSRNKTAIPIEIVMDNDDADMLEIMFNNGLKASNDAVLLRAVGAKTDKIVAIALKHGARPNIMNSTGQPILWLAIAKDDNTAAKTLIENGALLDVQDTGKSISPLSLAIARGNKEMANYLIEKGANPDLVDVNGFTSLAYAAASGQTDLVQNLIAHKAEVNAVDKNGNTILGLVDLSKIAKEKKEEIKKILQAAGAK